MHRRIAFIYRSLFFFRGAAGLARAERFFGGVAAGSEVTVTDAAGTEVVSFTTLRTTQSVTYSSGSIVTGDEYTITVAGTKVGKVAAG